MLPNFLFIFYFLFFLLFFYALIVLLFLLQFEDLSLLCVKCLQQQIMFALTFYILLLVYAFASAV